MTSITLLPSVQHTAELVRLRTHAALVRALLEEFDHAVPFGNGDIRPLALDAQIVEELTRFGNGVLACVAQMQTPAAPALGDSPDT